MLFDMWIQVSIIIDLIQGVIDTPIIFFVLCCMLFDQLSTLLTVWPFLVCRGCTLRIVTISLNYYGLFYKHMQEVLS